ncbi:type IX secretion system sortase PorU [Rasiella rasia]|uniref:Type IX secretion system sortase PorU n=1 Tax=Rasiella rasia TaxID=2744027 RepID=A0A6G6GP20_9FLAO|nr:type IX secretion system sortase PorU [Rasiella rasia]QIE60326.1 type IX secretion system sortase PorU [Rasiella rasia]
MKKLLLLLIFIALSQTVVSQSKQIVIPWTNTSPTNIQKIAVNQAKDTQLDTDAGLQLGEEKVLYQQQWAESRWVDEKSLVISNVVFAPISANELSKLNTKLIPSQVTSSIASLDVRGALYSRVSISPIVKEGNAYRKIVSFSVNYKFKSANRSTTRMPITNSVLASGDWYKFKVEETGVYRVSKDFLNGIGMNTDGIDPRNIKIYGHGGKPLPLYSGIPVAFDLPENAIQVVGEDDGSFDAGDFILFYGIGTKGYDLENDTNLNPYSDEAYYYVTASGGAGKRVQPMVEPTGNATTTISAFNDYKFHEVDEESPARVGRRWFGNRFDIENEQTYSFEFPNIVAQEEMSVVVKVAAASETSSSFAVDVNGVSVSPIGVSPITGIILLRTGEQVYTVPSGSETVTVDLAYNNLGNPSAIGYLDYIGVAATRRLAGTGSQLPFQYNQSATLFGVGEYQLTNASGFSQVWDVTNPEAITQVTNDGNASSFSFKANLGQLRNYVAIDPGDYFEPVEAVNSTVLNQNLKGTIFNDASGNFSDIDYLIITSPFLLQPALRLADHHRNLSGMRVKVVTTDKIYQEFSSGKQDISGIRNFVRYIYDNASSPNEALKYLCLFGDTSIDYKNRLPNNNNIVPTYHTLSSISTAASFMSDDFFGNTGAFEGTIGGGALDEFGNTLGDVDLLDIAVGRILADNVQLANTMVDKIINYASRASYGNWRNNFILISDDVDVAFEHRDLQLNLDNLGDQISANKEFVNVKKIHTDAFLQETSAGGNRYPTVTKEIQNKTEVGALIINYFGHGGEDGLAKEFIYTKGVAENLRNPDNLPCIVTVTCEFTKFDDPQRITAGELTFWNPEGGAISLITTTRSIFVSTGVKFNRELAPELFGYGTNDIPTPAEATRRAKNAIPDETRRVVFFIGDPASKLAFPTPGIKLTTIDGLPISASSPPLQALSKVTLGGEVTDENGALLSNYNGILEAKLFDKNVQRQTLANDGTRDTNFDYDGDGDPNNILILDFKTLGEGLFNGQASVTNGKFEFEFVVPRDIQIPVGPARLSLYAQNNIALQDQTGFNDVIRVGGLNENAAADNTGPRINLFMNDESFVSGGITNDSPILLAKLEDENGINTASGIGHDIIAILDGDESNPIVLNEFYQAEVDDFTRGLTSYNLRDLEKGLHTLTLRAWDVYNNSSTADIQFIVTGNDELEISRVLNYPNPFVNYTEFWFNHNRPFEPLEVQVQVFTVTGKVVWTKNQTITTDGFLAREIVWDGKDDFGDKIGKGVYVYKITVKSPLTNKQVEKFEKLVIL